MKNMTKAMEWLLRTSPSANDLTALLGVVLDDSSLVNKHILLVVVPVDEAVARLDVEPPDGSCHFGGNHLFFSSSPVSSWASQIFQP